MSFMTCCVRNCFVRLREGAILHCFPNPNTDYERFQAWTKNIGGEVATLDQTHVFRNRRVCHKHFDQIYYASKHRLAKSAIPTLYLPGISLDVPNVQEPVAQSAGTLVADKQPLAIPSTSESIIAAPPRQSGFTTIQKSLNDITNNIQQPSTSKEFVETGQSSTNKEKIPRTVPVVEGDPHNSDMKKFDPTEHQHNRYNPLKDEWVLVSPHRCKRPWSGQTEELPDEEPPDPNNPLRAGAVRSNGQRNPIYESTYVFPNDFPALLERVPEPPSSEHPLFQAAPAKGTCRVMCFHPDSSMTIPLMSVEEILAVINEWINQLRELGRRYTWVQIFENKGAIMGCSNPHPHCQIWASSFLPNEPRVKDRCQKEYYTKYGKSLLVDYLEQEMKKQTRIILQNSEWVALVPYWAVWPYESMVLPINGSPQRMTDLDEKQKQALAMIMKELTTKYDNLFKCSFPYSMGWHGAPTGPSTNPGDSPHWLFHGIYLPPLLRSATVKKFMVGYEMLAQSQRDLTPEQAAMKLRECSDVHYKSNV